MKDVDSAIELADAMLAGEHEGRTTAALITGMDRSFLANVATPL